LPRSTCRSFNARTKSRPELHLDAPGAKRTAHPTPPDGVVELLGGSRWRALPSTTAQGLARGVAGNPRHG
jgi:hypothetical protein